MALNLNPAANKALVPSERAKADRRTRHWQEKMK